MKPPTPTPLPGRLNDLGIEGSRNSSDSIVSAKPTRGTRGGSLLEATRGVTIALVSSPERKTRQPRLAPYDPAFVGRHQLVGGIQGSQVHFDFVRAAPENGRSATGTEKTPGIVARFTIDLHGILRKHRRGVKKGAMMLAAVETVTKADTVWSS